MSNVTRCPRPRRHPSPGGSCTLVLLCVLVLLLAACGTDAQPTEDPGAAPAEPTEEQPADADPGTPVAGGALRYGLTAGEPPSLDPLFGLHMSGTQVWAALFEQLFVADLDGSLEPRLAEDYEVSDDARTITVTVPDDVPFHNGETFDAHAVVAHFERAQQTEESHCHNSVATLDTVRAEDSRTVVFEMEVPHPEFPHLVLAGFCGFIPAPGAVEEAGEDFRREPVGTGPFRFVQWRSGNDIVVERFDDYRIEGRPYLDRIVYTFVPDIQTQVQSIRAGDMDVLVVSGYDQGLIDSAGDLEIHIVPVAGFLGIRLQTERAPFDSRDIRCAALLAIDTDVLAQVAYEGLLEPTTTGPVPEGSPVIGQNEWPTYDPERAAELIANHDGPVASIELIAPNYEQPAAQLVQQMWESVGLDVTIRTMDNTEVSTRILDERTYQAGMWNISGIFTPGRMAEHFSTGGRSNFGNYSNEEVDALFDRAVEESTLEARIPYYQEIYDLLVEDCPAIPTVKSDHFAVARSGVILAIERDPFGAKKFLLSDVWLSPDGN